MSIHLERARVLLEQGRFDMAEKSLRQAMAEDPESALPHALLALCISHQEKLPQALAEAREAVSLGPDEPFHHYVLGTVLKDMDRHEPALASALEAVRLDPEDADYRALVSAIHLDRRDWNKALEAAGEGLALDAEHVQCANLRAMALRQLGRKTEAGHALDASLSKDPENAVTHANMGWNLLDRGRPEQAMEHFREALRLDPKLDWARQGIVAGLKARYFIYGLILRYYLWMSKLSGKAQWFFVIGLYLLFRVFGKVAKEKPELAPFFVPLFILYTAFVLLSWVANPVFNLLLRLNRFGRLALSEEETRATNWVILLFVTALLFLGGGLLLKESSYFIAAALTASLVLPVSGTYNCSPGRGRMFLALYTAGLGLVAAAAIATGAAGSPLAPGLLGLYVVAWIAFQWIGNLVLQRS